MPSASARSRTPAADAASAPIASAAVSGSSSRSAEDAHLARYAHLARDAMEDSWWPCMLLITAVQLALLLTRLYGALLAGLPLAPQQGGLAREQGGLASRQDAPPALQRGGPSVIAAPDAVQERALRLQCEEQLRVAATREQQLQLEIRRLQQQACKRHADAAVCGVGASVFMAAPARLEMGDLGWMSDEHRAAHVDGVSSEHQAQMSRLMSAQCPSQVDWDYVDAHRAVLSAEQCDWTYVLCQMTPTEPQRAQSSTGVCGRRRVRGRRGGRRVRGASMQCPAAPPASPPSDAFSSSFSSPLVGAPLSESAPPCGGDEPAPMLWGDGAAGDVRSRAAIEGESIGARVSARHDVARNAAVATLGATPASPVVIQRAEPHRSSSDFQMLARAVADGALCCPRTAVRNRATVLVAMDGTAATDVLGSINCITRQAVTTVSGVWPRHMWVHGVWVRDGRRSQGIAHQLFASAEALAAERGLPLLRVAVNSENDAADQLVQLYEHIGYKVDGLACLRAQTKYIYLSKKVRVGARE